MIYDPVEVVIGQMVSMFRLKEWQYDIEDLVEEIAEALKLIGAAKIYEDRIALLTVNSYVAKLPYGLQHIKGIEPSSIPYRESGSFIEVNEPDGTQIKLLYQGMPLDARGYVLVPDAPEVRQALIWFMVKNKCLQKEITVVNFPYADREWDWRCGSARAALNTWSVQDAYNTYVNFTRLNPLKDQHLKNYEGLGKGNTLDREKTRDSSQTL